MKPYNNYRNRFQTRVDASTYDSYYQGSTYDSWVWEQEKLWLAQVISRHAIPGPAGYRMLDIACGSGRVLHFLEEIAGTAIGIDISLEMLALSLEKKKDSRLVCADISHAPFRPEAQFDIITAFRFFLNAGPDLREAALSLVDKHLADDGIFIFNVHANLASALLPMFLVRRYLLRKNTITPLTRGWARRLLGRHRFIVVEESGIAMLPRRAYRLLPSRVFKCLDTMLHFLTGGGRLATNIVYVVKKGKREGALT